MFIIASAIAAFIPISIYLFIIWWADKYEREPFKYVFYCFIYGAIGAIIISYFLSAVLSLETSFIMKIFYNSTLTGALIIAPFVEEVAKAVFLFTNFVYKKIDNLTDGLVYGGAIGLGFGMTENFLYFIFYGTDITSWISLVVIRSIFSAVMHCLSTATFGAFLSLAKFGNRLVKIMFPLFGIATSISIHFFWNFFVTNRDMFLYGFIFILLTILIFAFLFYVSLKNEKNIIVNELREEVALNIIPAEHINLFENKRYNLTESIDEEIKKEYINTLSKLAFTKVHLKNSTGIYNKFYTDEIESYRILIQSLLSKKVSEKWPAS